jgi:hypothetical protein
MRWALRRWSSDFGGALPTVSVNLPGASIVHIWAASLYAV